MVGRFAAPCFFLFACILLRPTAVAAAVPAPAHQTATAAQDPTAVAPVPVRARRLVDDEPEFELGDAATVLQGAEVRRQHRDLADALDRQAGLQVQRTGGFGAVTTLRIRGSTLEQVRYALDDVPLQALDGRPLDLDDLPIGQLERAEIHRGATPLALGGQSIGGAVRLMLRRPKTPGADLRLATGSHGSHLAEGSASWRALGGEGTAALRWLRSDGDHGYTFDGGTAFDASDDRWRLRRNNHIQRLGGLLRQSFRPRRGWRIEGRYLGSWREQGLPGVALFEAEESSLRHGFHDAVLHVSGRHVGLRGARLQGHVQAARRNTRVEDSLGELGMPQRLHQVIAGLSSAWRWLGPAWGPLRAEARVAADHGTVDQRDDRTGLEAPTSHRSGVTGGLGLPLRWASPEVSLLPSVTVAWLQSTRANLPVEADGWRQEHIDPRALTTWRMAASWQVQERVQLHGGWTRGLRAPTLSELFGNDGTVLGNPALLDERSHGLDAGVRLTTAGTRHRLHMRLSGFAMAVDDLIQLRRVSAHQARHDNLGSAILLGGECEAGASLGEHFQLSARYALLHGRDRSPEPEYNGNALPMRPRARIGGRLAVKGTPWARMGRLDGWLAGRWQSGHFTDRANRVAVPARASLDVGFGGEDRSGRLRVALRVDNLLGRENFDLIGYPLPGRTAMLNLTWRTAP